jgi:hypothetical protein
VKQIKYQDAVFREKPLPAKSTKGGLSKLTKKQITAHASSQGFWKSSVFTVTGVFTV